MVAETGRGCFGLHRAFSEARPRRSPDCRKPGNLDQTPTPRRNARAKHRHPRRGSISNRADTSPYGTINVVIEVKCTWNYGLLTDMQGQLRDRYLKNSNCRSGLYVAAHFSAQSWDESDYRRGKSDAWEINKLGSLLEEQAKQLSGSVLIRSFVLDVRLDSTKATGIREVDLR